MPKEPRYASKQTAIREMLGELGHAVVLRSEPLPSVFLDHEAEARFFGPRWPGVHAKVLRYFLQKAKTIKLKSFLDE